MKSLFNTVAAVAVAATGATAVSAQDLTIAIVNNGHMINMQKVAEAYTAETGVNLNWVALEEGVLREQVTSDTATGGGQYDIINIGMQEAPIWGAAGWIEPLNFSAEYDVDDILPAMRAGLSHNGTLYAAPFYGESSMVMYRKDLADAAGVKSATMTAGPMLRAPQWRCTTRTTAFMVPVCAASQAGAITGLSSPQLPIHSARVGLMKT